MTVANDLQGFSAVPANALPDSSGILVVSREVGGIHSIMYATFAENISKVAREAAQMNSFQNNADSSGSLCYLVKPAIRSASAEEHARKLNSYISNK